MGKQYTFKTTRDTAWIEKHLDSLGRLQRSEFIRDAIMCYMSDKKVTQDRQVTQERSDFIQPDIYHEPVPKRTIEIPNEPVFEAQDEDLDSKLDNLDF